MTQYEEHADEPKYLISVVTQMVALHPQTVRHYEDAGLIAPSRSKGNIRLYSQRDVERLQKINRLTRDLGINLAGVEVVLHMTERIQSLQEELETLQEELEIQMEEVRAGIFKEVCQTIREIGDESDRRWQEVIEKLESRF